MNPVIPDIDPPSFASTGIGRLLTALIEVSVTDFQLATNIRHGRQATLKADAERWLFDLQREDAFSSRNACAVLGIDHLALLDELSRGERKINFVRHYIKPSLRRVRAETAREKGRRRSTCINGHAFTRENTLIGMDRRFCRTCMETRSAAAAARKQAYAEAV